MKEAVTKVIDTLTQEDFHWDFQRFLELYNKWCYIEGDYQFKRPYEKCLETYHIHVVDGNRDKGNSAVGTSDNDDDDLLTKYLLIIKKVNLVTLIEGHQKAAFSIATTLRCREGRYSFPWIAPLYPWYVPYIAEC